MSDAGLERLTGYKRTAEQRRELDEMGIPYKARGKRTIVLCEHVAAWVEGRPVRRHAEPNMAAIT